jgi:Arc/MetJ-type ribon-helix-helix transcriptional regulator
METTREISARLSENYIRMAIEIHFMVGRYNISISEELYEKCKRFIENQGGFNSVDEFIEFVLSAVLSEEGVEGVQLSRKEEEKVKERLKALGYI